MICQWLDLSLVNLKVPIHVLSILESDPAGSCNIDNKVSRNFLWPRVWIFLSWYEQYHLVIISPSLLCLFVPTNFLRNSRNIIISLDFLDHLNEIGFESIWEHNHGYFLESIPNWKKIFKLENLKYLTTIVFHYFKIKLLTTRENIKSRLQENISIPKMKIFREFKSLKRFWNVTFLNHKIKMH